MFKVNNKDTRTLLKFIYVYAWFVTQQNTFT